MSCVIIHLTFPWILKCMQCFPYICFPYSPQLSLARGGILNSRAGGSVGSTTCPPWKMVEEMLAYIKLFIATHSIQGLHSALVLWSFTAASFVYLVFYVIIAKCPQSYQASQCITKYQHWACSLVSVKRPLGKHNKQMCCDLWEIFAARWGAAEVPDCPAGFVLQQRTWLTPGALHQSLQGEPAAAFIYRHSEAFSPSSSSCDVQDVLLLYFYIRQSKNDHL